MNLLMGMNIAMGMTFCLHHLLDRGRIFCNCSSRGKLAMEFLQFGVTNGRGASPLSLVCLDGRSFLPLQLRHSLLFSPFYFSKLEGAATCHYLVMQFSDCWPEPSSDFDDVICSLPPAAWASVLSWRCAPIVVCFKSRSPRLDLPERWLFAGW